ncbi:MAG: PQQ-binding-like beta-propeller repeat protein [Lentisphaeria bacterium]|nr:PQQ-binding-like beta-propeller repeat protein [Lentisphaeria bacterium]
MMNTTIRMSAIAIVMATLVCVAGDWPMYKGDAARSGAVEEALVFPLQVRWRWRSSAPPQPAWPQPGKELHRIDFDYAFQPVVVDGKALFASSADNTLRCLDLNTGALLWHFVADAPLRFAPAVAAGKVYLAGDDGVLRCLGLADGKPVWQFRAAPGNDMLLGNGRMVSRWPLRSGVLVRDGVAYVTAGLWPSEGIHVYALAADTGHVIWHNDSSGSVYMRFPHPVASGFGGVAPQGYLLASAGKLLVPTGRNIPAVFDRATGELLYYKAAEALQDGGAWSLVWRDVMFTPKNRFTNPSEARVGEAMPSGSDGMVVYSLKTGEKLLRLSGKYRVLAAGNKLFTIGGGVIECLDVSQWEPSLGKPPSKVVWTQSLDTRAYAVAVAGATLLVGGADQVRAYDADTGKPVWQAEVKGSARGLAAANGCLLVSTDQGVITCFANDPAPAAPSAANQSADSATAHGDNARAQALLENTGVRDGYAIVFGENAASLALGLARQSDLQVLVVLPSESEVQRQRAQWLGTGLYGMRITAFAATSRRHTPFPPYFADLVVVGGNGSAIAAAEACRLLHPCGGMLVCPDMTSAEAATFAESANMPELRVDPGKPVATRGKLPGSDDWKYPRGDSGRSGVNNETRVRLPLDVLWFGGPGPDRMLDRHLAAPPPLAVNGRAFVAGENHVIAFDAYTGRELWARRLSGAGRRNVRYYGANFVADEDSVYLAMQGQCLRLDQKNGITREVYRIPEKLLAQPEAPKVVALAKRTPWRFDDYAHRFFLTFPADAPPPASPCLLQGTIGTTALADLLGIGESGALPSARAICGGKELPVSVTLQVDGSIQVRALLSRPMAATEPLCVYLAPQDAREKGADSAGNIATAIVDELVVAYDFEQGDAAVRDLSAHGRDGRADGVSQVPGRTGKALVFDGKTSRMLVRPDKAFNATSGVTAAAWVKLDRADAGTILYKAYQYGLSVTTKDGKPHFSCVTRSGDFVTIISASPVVLGAWTHVALTHDGRTQRLYVDGELSAEGPQGELVTSDNYLCLGASTYKAKKIYNHLACTIDDVRIYARPLNQAEIRRTMSQPIPAIASLKTTWCQPRNREPRPIRDWDERGWGYLSVADGMVLGSYTASEEAETPWAPRAASGILFALNKTDGAVRWTYRAAQSVSNNEIAHSDKTLFLLDATANAAVAAARRRGEKARVTQSLVALRLSDGEVLWRQEDIPIPGARTYTPESEPNFLFIPHRSQLQVAHGVVVSDGIAAYDAESGKKLWQRSGRVNKLGAIHGDRLIIPPYAYDLRTGERCTETDALTSKKGSWRFIKAYGCGATVGCENLLLFRSGSFGFLDLNTAGTTTFGGGKPSCNVSMIPANGLVLMAEGSSGCACSYNFQTSLALTPATRPRDVWYTFPATSPWGAVKQLRLNFGAPGDRRDAAGNSWLGFPRPQLGGVSPVSVAMWMKEAAYFYNPNPKKRVKNTPWLYHCGLRARGAMTIDLVNRYGFFARSTETPPHIDGQVEETCWRQTEPTPFQDTERVALAPYTKLKFLRDDTFLYIAFRRRFSASTAMSESNQETFQIFLTDGKRKHAVRFGVQADGTAFEEGGALLRRTNLDRTWRGGWQHAANADEAGWTAEIAIPLAPLRALGLDTQKLYLNAMARLLTRHGQREIYLLDPTFRFAWCCRFLPFATPGEEPEERTFTVRIHSLTSAQNPADFAIMVQGQSIPMLAAKPTDPGAALVLIREAREVRARGTMSIEVVPAPGAPPPVINAIEIFETPSPGG